jgi:DNA-binding GntR family transcriptional regulator
MSNQIRRLEGPLTLRDRALETLRNQIIDCSLPPGKIIKDEELAAQLGISKTPLREALVQLAAEGLVEMPSNRLKRVAPLTRQSLLDIHFIYQTLRETAYRHGATRLTAAGIQEMEQALQEQRRAIDTQNWASSARQGRRFHEVIIKATGNEELFRLSCQYTHAIDRVSIMLRPASERIRNHEINCSILDAVKQGDTATAIDQMLAQSRQLIPLINSLPDEHQELERRIA